MARAEAVGLRPPAYIDPDQAWFWTPEWLEGEIEVSEQLAAGKTTGHLNDEEFLASLERAAHDADARRE